MSLTSIDSIFGFGQSVIERIWPDANKRAEEMRKLEELRQSGDLARLDAHVKLLLGQLRINEKEAEHKSIFVAGWRPMVGWVGASGLAIAFIPKAIVVTGMWTYQAYIILSAWNGLGEPPALPPYPDLGMTDLIGILGGILGIGGMRSFDKSKGTQTDKI